MLLKIADATFAADERVRIVSADLRDPGWVDTIPVATVDAVLTATALHWLPEADVGRLYHQIAALVRPGGVIAHAEQMPLTNLPRIQSGLSRLDQQRRAARVTDDAWAAWWTRAAEDPLLCGACEIRSRVFQTSYPTAEFSPPAEWHVAALEDAGFSEAGVVWRSGAAAVVAAIR